VPSLDQAEASSDGTAVAESDGTEARRHAACDPVGLDTEIDTPNRYGSIRSPAEVFRTDFELWHDVVQRQICQLAIRMTL